MSRVLPPAARTQLPHHHGPAGGSVISDKVQERRTSAEKTDVCSHSLHITPRTGVIRFHYCLASPRGQKAQPVLLRFTFSVRAATVRLRSEIPLKMRRIMTRNTSKRLRCCKVQTLKVIDRSQYIKYCDAIWGQRR